VAVSRICQCDICYREELAIQAALPDGWSLLWEYNVTLCGKCLSRWNDKFGGKPLLLITGGESILFHE